MSESGLDQNARTWGMICHLSIFAAYVIPCAGLVAPVVVWQLKKAEAPHIDYHGREAVNFVISLLCYSVGVAVFTMIPLLGLLGIPVAAALFVFGVVMPIIAAIKANDGEQYRYPFIFRLL